MIHNEIHLEYDVMDLPPIFFTEKVSHKWILVAKAENFCIKPDYCQVNSMQFKLTFDIENLVKTLSKECIASV